MAAGVSNEADGEHGKQTRLDRLVAVGQPELARALGTLLAESRAAAGTVAGSVSAVFPDTGTYVKVAEHAVPCRLGSAFPLDQGATGAAVERRRPVLLDDYATAVTGHLPVRHPARHGAVAAVPMWWRGDVIGVNVVFAGNRRHLVTSQLDALEVLTQAAAPPLARARATELPLAALLRARGDTASRRPDTVVTEVGAARPVSAAVATVAADLVTLAGAAAARRPGARLHVAVVYRPDGLRLLVQDEAGVAAGSTAYAPTDPLGLGTRTWHELIALAGGAVAVEEVPGWGTLVQADIPYAVPPSAHEPPPTPTPLTDRESEVLALLARGLTDRDISVALVLSPKTVEKHVGAVLRKTGAASRTAAVVTALERGWVRQAR